MEKIELAWTKKISKLESELQSNRERGLSTVEADLRLSVSGTNTFAAAEGPSSIIIFLRQLKSPLIIILIAAAAVTFSFAEYVDAVFILLAVAVSAVLGWFQEDKAERATASLRSYIEERVRIIRDGKEIEIDAKSIVPGDVAVLRSGERVPADGRLIEIYDLYADESILTGESLPVEKRLPENEEATPLPERSSMVFGGTFVSEGQGRALITATGLNTEFGKIAASVLRQNNEPTPLQRAVATMGWAITAVTLVLVCLVYAMGISRGMEHIDIFLVAVAIAVGAIPEALPPGLTAILAVGVERIAKQRGIVRSLLSAETLGSTTVVITDKTGTLTTGNLALLETLTVAALLGERETSQEENQRLLELAVANTNVIITDSAKPPAEWDISGRHLDVAIARAAGLLGLPVATILKAAKPIKLFNSVHKYSIFSYGENEVVLGAPDILLGASSLSADEKKLVEAEIDRLSHQGKRLLGIGLRTSDQGSSSLEVEFLGTLVFFDALRPGMKESIALIEQSGVKVVIATGDLPGTAKNVAGELGWSLSREEILTGEEMQSLTDAELSSRLRLVRLFARMTPEDKYRVVELIQAAGEVVAMLGDGVNDAPSLRRADIGVAVGSGTDVAKGVADLVLLDDDFRIIKAAIDEGRLILSNIRKVFVYLMSNCLDEIVLLGGSLALGFALPLSPLQVIWVNFATGSIPAVAYAFDRQGTFKNQREHAVLNREVLTLSFGIGLISSVLLLLLYSVLVTFGFDSAEGRTFLFACFSSYILFIAYSFRNLQKSLFSYPLFDNQVLNIGVVFGAVLLLFTIYLPFFQNLFGTVALSSSWLALVAGWLIINIALVEAAKWSLRRGYSN